MVIFKVAGSTILIILNSYLLLVGRHHNHHHHQKVFPRSLKHLKESNNEEKYFSRACIKAR